MSQPPEDLAERGRHIFESLRRIAEPHEVDTAASDPVDSPTEDADAEPESVGANDGGGSEAAAQTVDVTQPPPPTPWIPEPAPPSVAPFESRADQAAAPSGASVVPVPATVVDVTATAEAQVLPAPPVEATALASPASAPEAVAVPDEEPAEPDEAPPVLAPLPDEGVAEYPLPRIIAIANQKGGVGKTTTSVNLGAALAELGYRVLVVDLDPQGNATTGLGINNRNLDASIYDVLMTDVPMEDCIEPSSVRNLFVAPATIDLAGAEIELVPAFSRELKLRRALHDVHDDYDYTIIDCPPSLGLLTVNGLAAADDVIVPIQCEYYALEGLGQLLKNVALVRTNLNPALELRGIVLTMYDARTKLSEAVAKDVRHHFGAKVYRNIVPRTVRLSEAPSFGQPITVFDPSSRGAIAYRELAKEVSRGATRRTG